MYRNTRLNTKSSDIEESIQYAKKIQDAILPGNYDLFYALRDYFLFYQPRDVIGGDFYWVTTRNNIVVLVVGDCTGHGIPGALLTMLGTSALNDLVKDKNIIMPDEILNKLRQQIISVLYNSDQTETQDGIDISVCTIDYEKKILYFSGARNDVFFIHNGNMQELKADKMPIGRYLKMDRFTLKEFNYAKGDLIYLFSDGYKDQFGGKDGRKLGKKRFRELIRNIHFRDMAVQKEILSTQHITWKGLNTQVDDIVVLGVRLR